MAFGVVGNMVVNGATQLSKGQRPIVRELLLTPKNITRVTDQLSKMRGAAMKIGQLISMDSGDFLPPELAKIMTQLRNDAHPMPPAQLKRVINTQMPEGWLKSFKKFDVRPIAAASIGQVHRAQLKDGRDLAMKIQYPGVANSIDSDVANVGALIRMSGLLPKGFELTSYLEEGRKQLHEETDYRREGRQLLRFQNLLLDTPHFIVPTLQEDWCTPSILAMDYVVGIPIEDANNYTQTVRNQIITNLLDLTFRELFEFGLMQTDPNFANYLYKPATQQIVLLDFGAVRTVDILVGDQYRALIRAGLEDDVDDITKAAQDMGLFDITTSDAHRVKITTIIRRAFSAIKDGSPVNFSHDDLPHQLQAEGLALLEDGFIPPILRIDVLLIQRKFAGIFLLATRLKASLDLAEMLQRHIRIPDPSLK